MLTLKEIKPNIFELIEIIQGWIGNDYITHWYWDLDKMLISEKEDFPDTIQTRKLTTEQLLRFEEHYRPLIIRKEPINYEQKLTKRA